MNLLIDEGNTFTKIRTCHYHANKVVFGDLLEPSQLSSLPAIDKVISSSVKSTELQAQYQTLAYNSWLEVNVEPEAFGIRCGYQNYHNLGVDRWIGVLGAELLMPKQNLIIVDAGTATTVDFLTADKCHLGGWILPGIDLMQSSIEQKAPKVFSTGHAIRENIGTDTPSALKLGCVAAQQGSILQAISVFSQQLQRQPINLIITGGAGEAISGDLSVPYQLVPDLLFYGLSRFTEL